MSDDNLTPKATPDTQEAGPLGSTDATALTSDAAAASAPATTQPPAEAAKPASLDPGGADATDAANATEAADAADELEALALDPQVAGEAYFAQISAALEESPDGAWLGTDAHTEAFHKVTQAGIGLAPLLDQILRREPRLVLRYEALRLAATLELRDALRPTLTRLLVRAGFYPLMGRRLRALLAIWDKDSESNDKDALRQVTYGTSAVRALPAAIEASRARLHARLWFGTPTPDTPSIHTEFAMMATQGDAGLFGIARLLRESLEEEYILAHDRLIVFEQAAALFVQHNYFEGVQVFFDFLADCKPLAPGPQARKTVGAVLKAVRTLRPYRYPQWALPLQRFVDHYKSIKRRGRAAEANMLIILITSSTLEQALLLEDDELVDLLRGRRDAAYTEEEFEGVAALCDELLAAGREDCRIFHIRGWLAARIEGPEAAVPFFHQALNQKPDYVYPHLALASIYELWGEEDIYQSHLSAACEAEPTLISCQRKYGEVLQREGFLEEAILAYHRGLQVKPDQASELELEELFGCVASLASIYAELGDFDNVASTMDKLKPGLVMERFGPRFTLRQTVIIDLLHKGLGDFHAELMRDAIAQGQPSV